LPGLLAWQGVQVQVLGASGAVNVFDSHISWFATSYAARWVGWVAAVAAAGTACQVGPGGRKERESSP
jgi:ABC-type xylose transport system permease subunit